ncbi:hypothetical protein BJ912DRAFT_637856 [Pholiota molesta]|nr:hypothetical protein BJ912DRAFT_637856 [Pholiota molesta]
MSSPVLSTGFSDIRVSGPSGDVGDDLSGFPAADNIATNSEAAELQIDMLPAVHSFLPIIERLPGLILDHNLYYIDKPLVKAELEQLISYARRIRELILTDPQLTSHPDVAPETLARLALIQDPNSTFLTSLECLRIIDANKSLSYLFFCVAPSLKSLEIIGVPTTRQITISSFLKELVLRVPELLNLTFRGRLSESSLQSSLKFNHLRQLHLIDAAESLDFAFLQGVSELPELDSFVIDARAAEYKRRLVPADNTSLTSTSNGVGAPNLSTSTEDQTIIARDPSSIPFRQLRELTVTGNVNLMDDLVFHFSPRAVKVSLTLVRTPDSNAPASVSRNTQGVFTFASNHGSIFGSASVSREKQGAFGVASKSYGSTFGSSKTEDLVNTMSIEELKWILNQSSLLRGNKKIKTKIFTTLSGGELQLTIEEEDRCRDRLKRLNDAQQVQEPTSVFAGVVEKILTIGTMDSFVIDYAKYSEAGPAEFPFEFPSTTLEALLSYPTLKELKIAHWALPSMEKIIVDSTTAPAAASPMSMQKLQLPVDRTSNSGISMFTLELIARYYPRLLYLECFVQTSSAAALQPKLGTDIMPHDLETLSVGGVSLAPSPKDKAAVAAYLSLLFPHLKTINTHKGYHEDDWEYIYTLVTMCHTVSLATEKRLQRVIGHKLSTD